MSDDEFVKGKSDKHGKGKTNKHKSTLKAHTLSQIASAVPKSHGKPPNTTPPKRRAR